MSKKPRSWPLTEDARIVVQLGMEKRALALRDADRAFDVARNLSEVPFGIQVEFDGESFTEILDSGA